MKSDRPHAPKGRPARNNAKPRPWKRRDDRLLTESYGLMPPEEIARKLRRSKEAVIIRAGRLGLDSRYVPGLYTVREAAVAAQVTVNIVRHALEKGLVTPTGEGKSLFLAPREVRKLQRAYPLPPFRSVTMPEACKLLGYGHTHMLRLMNAGLIKGVKRGLVWHVDAYSVEKLAREILKSGAVRMDLLGIESMDEQREKCRLYARTRRKERRHADRETTWMTFVSARQALGIRRDALRELLESGRLQGKRENGLWLVLRAAVEERTETRGQRTEDLGRSGAGEVDNA